MLIIRQSQMKALSQVRRSAFEADAVSHVHSLFPEDCGALTEEQVRARVRDGIARGRSYGLNGRDDLLIFVEHLFILGPEFDRTAEYGWARHLLMRSEYASATKAELLAKLTLRHLRRARFEHGR
jgi:hypothetical protein